MLNIFCNFIIHRFIMNINYFNLYCKYIYIGIDFQTNFKINFTKSCLLFLILNYS